MKSWIYRQWVMLLSALSWMHWRRKMEQRRWEREKRFLLELQMHQRMVLLQAMTPLSEALQRLDNLQQKQWQQTHVHLMMQEELLKEVLNSLQPPVSQQIFPQTGQPVVTNSYPSSES